jgi:ribonuclease Z
VSLCKDIVSNIDGFSAAMYSTWLYYRPARLLFDAGEGVSITMRNFIFGVESVFISHGHYDHIGGLAGMIYSRASARGDKEKPLTVYHPSGWDAISSFRRYVETSVGHIKYDLEWVAVEPGQEIEVGDGRAKAVAFSVEHASRPCLGFRLVEDRSRLKASMTGLSGKEIAAIVSEKGRDAVKESYRKTILAYCGDSSPVRASNVAGADVLIHEATFLNGKDRDRKGHSTVREAVEVACEAGVEALIVTHVSGRYSCSDAVKELAKTVKEISFGGPVFLLANGDMITIQ